jgi:uncharacterized protein (DUF488 family)
MATTGVYGFDAESFLERVRHAGVRLLLDVRQRLCVERDPEACHRSLVAQRLTERYHITIERLRPP